MIMVMVMNSCRAAAKTHNKREYYNTNNNDCMEAVQQAHKDEASPSAWLTKAGRKVS